MAKITLNPIQSFIIHQRLQVAGSLLIALSVFLSSICDHYPLEDRLPFRLAQLIILIGALVLMMLAVRGIVRARTSPHVVAWQKSQAEKQRNTLLLVIGGATTSGALAMLVIVFELGMLLPDYLALMCSLMMIGTVAMLIADFFLPRVQSGL